MTTMSSGTLKPHQHKVQKFFPQVPDPKGGAKFSLRRKKDELKVIPVPEERIQRWRKGEKFSGRARTKYHTEKIKTREGVIEAVAERSARSELLCTEESGQLQGDETNMVTQGDIKSRANEITQQKIFDLQLAQFGPYRMDYTRNGRHLLIGGQKGHIAAFDWQSKKLHCEINVMETITDVKWLHQETLFAVSQKRWTYIYDNQGIEVHCLKHLDVVQRMEFLPYHFLLVSSNGKGYLSYLDVSIGKEVAGVRTRQGRLDVMAVNPQSAVVSLGHPNGVVSFWVPSMKEPAAKVLCHHSGVRDIAIDASGNYMATTGLDRKLKIFDLRTLGELSRFQYGKRHLPGLVDFSQKSFLAVSRDNVVEVYKDMTSGAEKPEKPYMYHRCERMVGDMAFCPFEDVLGMGHSHGFSSIVIPGAGEVNFDALEANPFQTKSQRKETEVRLLLDKVSPDMISMDSNITQVDLLTAEEQQEERNRIKFLKPAKIDFTPRKKKRGGSSGLKEIQRKKGVQQQLDREAIRGIVRTKQEEDKLEVTNEKRKISALDRMKRKIV